MFPQLVRLSMLMAKGIFRDPLCFSTTASSPGALHPAVTLTNFKLTLQAPSQPLIRDILPCSYPSCACKHICSGLCIWLADLGAFRAVRSGGAVRSGVWVLAADNTGHRLRLLRQVGAECWFISHPFPLPLTPLIEFLSFVRLSPPPPRIHRFSQAHLSILF